MSGFSQQMGRADDHQRSCGCSIASSCLCVLQRHCRSGGKRALGQELLFLLQAEWRCRGELATTLRGVSASSSVHPRGRKGDLTAENLPYKGSSQSGAEESRGASEDPYGRRTERGAMLAPRAGLSRIVSACARTLTSSPRALQQHAEATSGYNGYASSFGPFQYEGAPLPSLFPLLS